MSRTALILKFKMCLFLDEASYWAEKLLTDINLPPLMSEEDNNFGGSLMTSRPTQEYNALHLKPNTAVSRKIVPQKCESVRDNAERCYG